MGLLVAELFNSPFALNQQGKVSIISLEKIGYCFFGPLVKFFLDKLYQDTSRKGQKIIFLARDCWLLKKIADRFYTKYGVSSEYILTSRRAISVATALEDRDIEDAFAIFGNTVCYTFSAFCDVIFDIRISRNDPYYDTIVANANQEKLQCHLKRQYGQKIKENALKQRERYLAYLKESNIWAEQKLAVVNFVGSGITQSLFEKLGFRENCEYYYFAITPLNVEMNPASPKTAYFPDGSIYTSCNNAVVKYTVLGECIFSSPTSQFMGFDSGLAPVFADDGVNHEYEKIEKCHEGIERYLYKLHGMGMNFCCVPAEFINETYGVLFDIGVLHVSHDVRGAFQMKDIIRSDKMCLIWE